jgi:hypothetical protein
MSEEFEAFPKIARLSREIVITEKIDGTNAQIYITKTPVGETDASKWELRVGSRSRWITPEDDNHGFAKWVFMHMEELIEGLGEGRHYGEWWGSGVQRGYGGKILQQKTLPITLDINHAIVPNGKPGEWENVHITMRDMNKDYL